MFKFSRILNSLRTVPKQATFSPAKKQIHKLVLKSSSSDIYKNLALEDWFYQNHDLENCQILLFYRNDPCVVIGRHQNPWTEANVPYLRSNGIALARRNSGGGTVFHDQGNINLSFLTSKADYNRSKNLNLICDALKDSLGVDVSVNKRDDIVIDGVKKISGTAAKIGRKSAYHHCTLLVDVDTTNLHQALSNPAAEAIETNATKSIRSPVENLSTQRNSVDIKSIEYAIAEKFGLSNIIEIQPIETEYKGLDKLEENYRSWSWIYGKSPKFSLSSKSQKLTVINGKASLDSEDLGSFQFDTYLADHLENASDPELVCLGGCIRRLV